MQATLANPFVAALGGFLAVGFPWLTISLLSRGNHTRAGALMMAAAAALLSLFGLIAALSNPLYGLTTMTVVFIALVIIFRPKKPPGNRPLLGDASEPVNLFIEYQQQLHSKEGQAATEPVDPPRAVPRPNANATTVEEWLGTPTDPQDFRSNTE